MTVMFTTFQVKNVISALVTLLGHFIFMVCGKTTDATSFVHN
jgi:hypothetical protein